MHGKSKYCLELSSPHDTEKLATIIASELWPGAIVGLDGELGAGKTFFVQSAAHTLGVPPDLPVNSPTFPIIQEYTGKLTIFHIDLYRIKTFDEITDLGLDEYLYGKGITFIEWFNVLGPHILNDFLLLSFEISGLQTRTVGLEFKGTRYEQIVLSCTDTLPSVPV